MTVTDRGPSKAGGGEIGDPFFTRDGHKATIANFGKVADKRGFFGDVVWKTASLTVWASGWGIFHYTVSDETTSIQGGRK